MASRDGKQLRVLTNDVRMIKFKEEITVNWKNKGNLNPKVMIALHSTTPGTFTHVVLAELDDKGAEFALRVAHPDEEGALELKYSESGRTAHLVMTLMVTKYPALATPKQRIRHFPVVMPEGANPGYLILKAKESYLTVVPKRKKKGESAEEAEAEPKASAEAKPGEQPKIEATQAIDQVATTKEKE